MASDERKKRIESLRKSISDLETQETLVKSDPQSCNSKVKLECIRRLIGRFEADIDKLKKS